MLEERLKATLSDCFRRQVYLTPGSLWHRWPCANCIKVYVQVRVKNRSEIRLEDTLELNLLSALMPENRYSILVTVTVMIN
jgi:hypothetical protein